MRFQNSEYAPPPRAAVALLIAIIVILIAFGAVIG